MATKLKDIRLRYANRGDISDLARIDVATYSNPMTMKMFIERLEQSQLLIEVVEQDNQGVLAYLISQHVDKTTKLLRVAAYPEYWHLVNLLVIRRKNEVYRGNKDKVTMFVPESMLVLQLLLRDEGFFATKVLRNYYPETDEAAYVMDFTVRAQLESPAIGPPVLS